MTKWFRVLQHNPTEFTSDLPALLDAGLEYRTEVLEKVAKDFKAAVGLGKTLMTQCILNFGMFEGVCDQKVDKPNGHDYLLHLSLGLLLECCSNERIPAIVPRIILNNLAIKLSTGEMVLESPRHQQWALHVFH